MREYQQIDIYNVNGERFTTYAIPQNAVAASFRRTALRPARLGAGDLLIYRHLRDVR
ncbi:MAG: hypothetical protein M5R42_05015 [Rhodocyclaceae bacterium]|nr:hypothetical protein [Rhodocyclaceae bacterium]